MANKPEFWLDRAIDGTQEVDIRTTAGKLLATVYPPEAERRANRIIAALKHFVEFSPQYDDAFKLDYSIDKEI